MDKIVTAYKDINLEFNEEKHQLFVDGIRNPYNVTGITSVIDKSQPLIWWATTLAKDHLLKMLMLGVPITESDVIEATGKHREAKEKAGSIGDVIHEFAEQFSLELKPAIPTEEKARNGVLAFLKWLEEEKITISHPEEVLYSKKNDFWGIKDSDGKRGDQNFVIDYKTSKNIYPEMRLQASAYLFAAEEMLGRKYDGYWIVKFGKEDGNFEPLYVPYKEAKKDFKAFLAAFELKKRLLQLNAKG